MLNDSPIFPSIRVTDIKEAREFYEEKLGLKVIYDKPGILILLAGKNSRVLIYEGPRSVAEHTVAMFYVDDVEQAVDGLGKKGVVFEQYPELGTNEKGISEGDDTKVAWFKDPDGHVLGLSQIK